MSTLEWTLASIGGLGLVILLISLVLGDLNTDTDASAEIATHVSFDGGHEIDGPSWHSMSVLAASMFGFGFPGFLAIHAGVSPLIALPLAVICMGLMGVATFSFARWVAKQQTNSLLSSSSYIRSEGQLTLPISKGGRGQVKFLDDNGSAQWLIALTADGSPLPTGAHVLIIDVTTEGAVVSPNPNFELEE